MSCVRPFNFRSALVSSHHACDGSESLTSHLAGIAELFVKHRSRLEAIVMRRVRDRAAAEDIVQDVFVRILQAGSAGSAEADIKILYAAARHAAIDHAMMIARRSSLLAEHVPEQTAPVQASVSAALEARDTLAALDRALAELSPRARQIFILHRVEGLPNALIAQRLGITVSAVEKQLARTFRHCQKRLGAYRD
jgi:RNA polymerase sigma factor (sigma-70 family)